MNTTTLTPEKIFGDIKLGWGNKYANDLLLDVWKKDRSYLFWAANLQAGKPCDRPPADAQVELIRIAHLSISNEIPEATRRFGEFEKWYSLSQFGEGLSELPRTSPEKAQEILSKTTVLAGHSDLDGIFSLAIAIHTGEALKAYSPGQMFSRLRLLHYYRRLDEFSQVLNTSAEDTTVIIDFAAHPSAALTLDHHATCLNFWPCGSPLPTGIYDTAMPSCPRLLSTHCNLKIDEEILKGCDLVDGAQYKNVEETFDFRNPFVALEHALSVDVSEQVGKKVVLTLSQNKLDPWSVLNQPIWQARLKLVTLALEEQRVYWSKESRFNKLNDYVIVSDARLAPYSSTRFRFLPYENEQVRGVPFSITVRPSGLGRINLGIARNPFYANQAVFKNPNINLGALAKKVGSGGGRKEAAATSILQEQLNPVIDEIKNAISAWMTES